VGQYGSITNSSGHRQKSKSWCGKSRSGLGGILGSRRRYVCAQRINTIDNVEPEKGPRAC